MWALLRFAFARILPKSQNASEHEIETGDYINDLGFTVAACAEQTLISPVEPVLVESFAAPPPGSDPNSC